MSTTLQTLFGKAERTGLFNGLDDETFLKMKYRIVIGKRLNLSNPKTFNEKLQWLKLHDRKKHYTIMVDKYEVKKYVAEKIGEEFVIPTLGVWNSFDEIDFNMLPDQFVLKCTHDSGGVVICKDKNHFNIESAKRRINKCLKKNFFFQGREWPYKNVKPRIIAEKYMEDYSGELIDYKIHNFEGEPRITLVCTGRFSEDGLKEDFFDMKWNRLDLKRPNHLCSKKPPKKPENFDKMVECSKILAKDVPFVRTDFYEINGKMYFGEITFYPADGMQKFEPEEYDRIMGDWIELPLSTSCK